MSWLFYSLLGFMILPWQMGVLYPRVDALAILLAYAYFSLGLGRSLLLSLLLTLLYSTFSLGSFWQWWLFYAAPLVLFSRLKNMGITSRPWGRFWLLVLNSFFGIFLWQACLSSSWRWGIEELGEMGTTILVGGLLLPYGARLIQFFWDKLPRPKRSMGEVSLFRFRRKRAGPYGASRKPFGFEEGL